jgi:fucose permease
MGMFAGMFFPSSYVTASRKMGEDPRVAPSIIAAGLVGGIIAPLVLSPFLGQMGDRGFFWVVAAVTGASAVVGITILRPMNR